MVLQHSPNNKEFHGTDTRITGKFLSDRSFADQFAHESFRENSSGDIAVLANCKSLSVFGALGCTGITGKFLSDRSFADQSAYKSFREKSYVALLFVELPPDFTQLLFFSSGDKTAIKRALPECWFLL